MSKRGIAALAVFVMFFSLLTYQPADPSFAKGASDQNVSVSSATQEETTTTSDWLRGVIHVHPKDDSTLLDLSVWSIAEIAQQAKAEGFQFAIVTPHMDRITEDVWNTMQANAEIATNSTGVLIVVDGEFVSKKPSDGGKKQKHVLGLSTPSTSTSWVQQTIPTNGAELVDDIHTQDRWVFLAHPLNPAYPWSDEIEDVRGKVEGMEIRVGTPLDSQGLLSKWWEIASIARWTDFLQDSISRLENYATTPTFVVGISGADSNGADILIPTTDPFAHYFKTRNTWVYCPNFPPSSGSYSDKRTALLNALRQGRVVATGEKALVDFVINGKRPGDTLTVRGDQTLNLSAISSNAVVASVEVFNQHNSKVAISLGGNLSTSIGPSNPSFPHAPGFFRAVSFVLDTDLGGTELRGTYSNPVFLDLQGGLLSVDNPTSQNPAYAGPPANPRPIEVRARIQVAGADWFIQGLSASNFQVRVGGFLAVVSSCKENPQDHSYLLTIAPPNQVADGLYPLLVSAKGVTGNADQAVRYSSSTGSTDLMFVLDRSGSMLGDKLAAAKSVASQFADRTGDGNMLGLVAFDDIVELPYPLSVVNPVVRQGLKSQINALTAGDNTAMLDALWKAKDEIASRTTTGHNRAALLLSDGWSNSGRADPLPVIAACVALNIKVYCVGLGSSQDAALLSQLAQGTGGRYYNSPTPADLDVLFNEIFGVTQQQSTAATGAGTVWPYQTFSSAVPVDPSMNQATFSTNWQGSTVDLSLVDPFGRIIDALTQDPLIAHVKSGTYEFYQVQSPVPGSWTMRMYGADVPSSGEAISYSLLADTPLRVELSTNKAVYLSGEPIRVSLGLHHATGPIPGATVLARLLNQNGAMVDEHTLYDDGKHNDGYANDGIYGGDFAETYPQGSYTIHCTGQGEIEGYPFMRDTRTSLLVSGYSSATISLQPGSMNLGSEFAGGILVGTCTISSLIPAAQEITFNLADLAGPGTIPGNTMYASPDQFTLPGYQSQEVQLLVALPTDLQPGTYSGLIGASGSGQSANLLVSLSVSAKGAFSGNVRDEFGDGIADATVMLTQGPSFDPDGVSTTTDSTGYYLFSDLLPGTYSAVAILQSSQSAPVDNIHVLSNQTTTGINFLISRTTSIFILQLGNGWNMISLPVATNSSPASVFGSLAGSWSIYQWNATQGRYLGKSEISLAMGNGYWLKVGSAQSLTVAGSAVQGDQFSIPLAAGWNQIGHPFLSDKPWSAVNILFNGGKYTLDQAADAGIIGRDLFTWNSSTYQSVKTIGCFQTGLGYWVKSNQFCVLAYGSGSPSPFLSVDPAILDLGSSNTQGSFTLRNIGQGTLTWNVTKSAAWITSLNPLSGSLGPGGSAQMTVSISRSGLASGNYQGFVDFTSNGGNAITRVNISVSTNLVEILYDDDDADNAWAKVQGGNGFAVRMTPPAGSSALQAVSFRFWGTDWPDPGATPFQWEIWNAAGVGGAPGSKIAGPYSATANRGGWTSINTSGLGITVSGDFYVLYKQLGDHPYCPGLTTDNDGPYYGRSWDYQAGVWSQWPETDFTNYGGKFMIRATVLPN